MCVMYKLNNVGVMKRYCLISYHRYVMYRGRGQCGVDSRGETAVVNSVMLLNRSGSVIKHIYIGDDV
jgi:hypothetical protein